MTNTNQLTDEKLRREIDSLMLDALADVICDRLHDDGAWGHLEFATQAEAELFYVLASSGCRLEEAAAYVSCDQKVN